MILNLINYNGVKQFMINPVTQLKILMYEYLMFRLARMEQRYIDLLDKYYRDMYSCHPEKRITYDELFSLVVAKSQLDDFKIVQRDIIDLLDSFGCIGYDDK